MDDRFIFKEGVSELAREIADGFSQLGQDASEAATDKRKQSLYFPEQMLKEIQEEAAQLDPFIDFVTPTFADDTFL